VDRRLQWREHLRASGIDLAFKHAKSRLSVHDGRKTMDFDEGDEGGDEES
jgi:hypothetical protein